MWMNLENMLREINRSQRTNTVGFRLYEILRVDTVIETESRREVTRGREWGDGKLVFQGYRISVRMIKNVLQMGRGDGYTTQ